MVGRLPTQVNEQRRNSAGSCEVGSSRCYALRRSLGCRVPFPNRVAVCYARSVCIPPVGEKVPPLGSYNSALATAAPPPPVPSIPPVIRTRPSLSRVAVCLARGTIMSAVALKVPIFPRMGFAGTTFTVHVQSGWNKAVNGKPTAARAHTQKGENVLNRVRPMVLLLYAAFGWKCGQNEIRSSGAHSMERVKFLCAWKLAICAKAI